MDDRQLLNLISQNSERALDELFTKYFYRLCGFAAGIIESRETAEEIVSDVFIAIWLNRKKIEIHNNVGSYLFAAVKNRALTELTHNKKTIKVDDLTNCKVIDTINADTHLTYNELSTEIDALLHRLPEQQKIILKLNRIDGYTPNEIATMLDISPKTVYAHLREALSFLMQHRRSVITKWTFLLLFLR